MDDFFYQLKTLLAKGAGLSFGSVGFYITVGITAVALYFIGGWVLKVVFGQERGRVKPFFALLATLATTLLLTAATQAWVTPSISNDTLACVVLWLLVVAGLGLGVYLAKIILGLRAGPVIGFLVLSGIVGFAALWVVGTGYSALGDAVNSFEKKQEQVTGK